MKLSIRKLSLVLGTAFALMAMTGVESAHAVDGYKFKSVYIDRSSGVKIKVKEKLKFGLNGWKHVRKVKVKTNGASYRGLTIYANGSPRIGTYVGGYYEFDVNESIDQIELMNAAGADCILGGITVLQNEHQIVVRHAYGSVGLSSSFPSEVVHQIINETAALAYYVSLDDQKTYLEPIRIAAGRAIALTMGRGEFSMKTGNAILALIAQIDFAEQFVTERFQVDATYWNAVHLVASKERLADLLD